MMWTHWNELVFNNPELGGIRSGWGQVSDYSIKERQSMEQ